MVITPAPPPAELSPDGSNAVRVFAIVLGLFAMASTALMLTMLAVALSVGGTRDAPVVTAKPPPMKAKKDRYRDTGRVEPIREKKTTRKTTKTSKKKAVPDKAKTSKKKATTAPGMLVLHVPADSGFRGVEVNCPGGYRERASFTDGKATLSGVPAADCSAHFKGPFPVKAKVSGGMSRSCTFVGTTARCVPK